MKAQHIRIGFCLLVAQLLMLAMTHGFHSAMDASAARAGLTEIIQEAGR